MDSVVKDEVEPQLQVMKVFSQSTVELSQLLTKLFVDKKDNIIEYDRAGLVVAQRMLKDSYPDLEREIDGIVVGNTINFHNLFKVFMSMLPSITEKLGTFQFRDLEALEYESKEVEELDTIASKHQDEYNRCAVIVQPFIEADEKRFKKWCENKDKVSPFCLMQTPTIPRRCQVDRISNRLALTDLIGKTNLFKEPTVRTGASKNAFMAKASSSMSLHNKSEHPALHLLSKPKSRGNLSQLSMCSMSTKFSTPRFSSTMSSNGNRMNHPSELQFTPSFPVTPTHVFSDNLSVPSSQFASSGLSAVHKIATSSAFQPNIRSPTSRFQVSDVPRNLAATVLAVNLELKIEK